MRNSTGKAGVSRARALLRLLVLALALQSFTGGALAGYPPGGIADALENAAAGQPSEAEAGPMAMPCAGHERASAASGPAPHDGPRGAEEAAETCTTMLCCFGEPAVASLKPYLRLAERLSQRVPEAGSPAPMPVFPLKRPPRLT